MSLPLVSVITPTYNHAAYIQECLRSALDQSVNDIEILVVDDGSTDGTPDLARELNDPRVRVFAERNRGIARLGETYNLALSESRGEFVAILEGDDKWYAKKLERQLVDFQNPGVVLSAGRFHVIDETGRVVSQEPRSVTTVDQRENRPVGRAGSAMLHHDILTFAFPVTVMMRKSALLQIGGFRQSHGLPLVDYPTILAMSLQGEWRFHATPLAVWRRHSASTTLSKLPKILDGVYACAMDFWRRNHDRLPMEPEEQAHILRHWQYFFLQRCIINGRWRESEGNYQEAAAWYRVPLTYPATKFRTRSALRVAAYLAERGKRTDGVFRAIRRGDWRKEMYTSLGDPLVSKDESPSDYAYRSPL
jgi:hypothetical protein